MCLGAALLTKRLEPSIEKEIGQGFENLGEEK